MRRAARRLPRMPARAFPVLYSRSVSTSERFYQQLGFEETFRLPPEGEPGFELFVYVDDVDAEAKRFQSALLKPPVNMPWGERIAYVRDPDGNPVALAAPISS